MAKKVPKGYKVFGEWESAGQKGKSVKTRSGKHTESSDGARRRIIENALVNDRTTICL
jgi:hypothetical protein